MAIKNLQPSILIVEDDDAIVALLEYNLEKEGYKVRFTDNSEDAFMMIDEDLPDMVLLDWMLPGVSGVEICKQLRNREDTKTIPIIMLSARGEESDRVDGLEGGVDDYLVKPFSPRELIARINAVLRRLRPIFQEEKLSYADIEMDLNAKKVIKSDEELHLGPTEYKILQALMENPTRVLSREQLIGKVWNGSLEVEERTVDVHINRLRKSLKSEGKDSIIRTVRSSGYCLAT